jgi:hypothetical protein
LRFKRSLPKGASAPASAPFDFLKALGEFFSAFIPFNSVRIESKLSESEAMPRLNAAIELKCYLLSMLLPLRLRGLPGLINHDTLIIHRTIRYRNSFLPLAFGRFVSDAGTTALTLTLWSPGSLLLLFTLIGLWVYGMFAGGHRDFLLAFTLFACVVHIVGVVTFYWEREKLLRRLEQILRD